MIYLAFRDFLPWLNGPGYDLDQSAASAVKKAVSRLDFREAVSIIEKLDRHRTVGALVTIFQCLAGLPVVSKNVVQEIRQGSLLERA
jgi:hypothetical protein